MGPIRKNTIPGARRSSTFSLTDEVGSNLDIICFTAEKSRVDVAL